MLNSCISNWGGTVLHSCTTLELRHYHFMTSDLHIYF